MTHSICRPECFQPGVLTVQDLSVQYGPQTALDRVSVSFQVGEFSAVIGPNGAGKSTLLKSLLGLVPRSSGQITYGTDTDLRPHIAYVPQQQTLDWAFPVTVWDVAMMGRTGRLGWGRWPGLQDRRRVQDALQETGVWDLRHRHIADLSGGQRQRVLLARMLVRGAAILLLDEPLTGVDTRSSEQILALLRAEADAGRAVIMVTHDLEQAAQWCDHLVLVNRRVVADGPPAQVYTPANIEATFSVSHLGHGHAEA
ncbi:metal ABC transporter ATP-binding protein [Deinococcus radiophilus]|uniref:Metal ABC transporter ATP-binding protein n=1 Tax=Deinococcus radiophilus TaxID=32062 RepID=A0A431W4B9_9DEIO|nr:metal ABC transporter ATP-binding protein [Deinococcus radiophilus]RTR30244.1 metal ABC transporter ATP-binding protein [Deinococcus radiophilus]UFA49964.1 metal ABC transporter ATP-binding protein [Deinococcus radiophilus]